jgi:hypothetical protein
MREAIGDRPREKPYRSGAQRTRSAARASVRGGCDASLGCGPSAGRGVRSGACPRRKQRGQAPAYARQMNPVGLKRLEGGTRGDRQPPAPRAKPRARVTAVGRVGQRWASGLLPFVRGCQEGTGPSGKRQGRRNGHFGALPTRLPLTTATAIGYTGTSRAKRRPSSWAAGNRCVLPRRLTPTRSPLLRHQPAAVAVETARPLLAADAARGERTGVFPLRYITLVLIPFRNSGRENAFRGHQVQPRVVLIPFRNSGRENRIGHASRPCRQVLIPFRNSGRENSKVDEAIALICVLIPFRNSGRENAVFLRQRVMHEVLIPFRKSGREN